MLCWGENKEEKKLLLPVMGTGVEIKPGRRRRSRGMGEATSFSALTALFESSWVLSNNCDCPAQNLGVSPGQEATNSAQAATSSSHKLHPLSADP